MIIQRLLGGGEFNMMIINFNFESKKLELPSYSLPDLTSTGQTYVDTSTKWVVSGARLKLTAYFTASDTSSVTVTWQKKGKIKTLFHIKIVALLNNNMYFALSHHFPNVIFHHQKYLHLQRRTAAGKISEQVPATVTSSQS